MYEYKYDVQRLQGELQLLNVQYFEQQRKKLHGGSAGSSRPQSGFQSYGNEDGQGHMAEQMAEQNYDPPADPFAAPPPADPFADAEELQPADAVHDALGSTEETTNA